MWTIKETVKALRGERATILRNWQTTAQQRLWHLDSALFTRKGVATRLVTETLLALLEFHQARESEVSLPAPDALPAAEDALSDTLPSEAEAAEDAPSLQATVFAPGDTPTTMEARVVRCADGWGALSLPWADIRAMLEILGTHTNGALTVRGADADTLALSDGLFATLAAAVADRKITQLEQQIAAHREELAVIQHLAGRFLANTSHELRTPLTAILGFAELLTEDTYGALNVEQRTAIGHIENSAQNLLEVINNLLDLLRIRAGKLSLQYRPLAIIPLMRHIYDILMPLATRKQIAFSLELSEELGIVEADENILRHMIYHLLASSLRATPSGGSVTLHAKRDQAMLIITTHDTGLHLPPEAIANMSEVFPLLENSPARGYEGWEVGLPLVRRYVEIHEGVFDLVSNPGEGTTFRIILPAVRNAKG